MASSEAEGYCYSNQTLFHKRIEFHPARKHHSSFNGVGYFPIDTLNPRINGIPSSKDDNNSKVVDHHGLDPDLSLPFTCTRIGAGLQNLGNTGFLNSVLQCLTYTEPFAAYLQSGKHKTSCQITGFCALCAIQNHVRCALQSTGTIIAPSHLVTNVRCISRNFRSARQEDAHEYLVNLLELMHKCCLPSGLPSESPSAYEKSLVYKIFGGRLRSQVKCTECLHGSNKYDPFLNLSTEIAKANSLVKALRNFTAVEEFNGGEKQYYCQRCNQKVRATRQLMIHKAPYVLAIHLKRFGSGEKINKRVEFGPTLDLKPFVTGSHEGDLKYTLYGVLVHDGWSTHLGHFYSFVRTSSGMWHGLNDNEVFQVKEKTVLEQKAYMLFYILDRRSISTKKTVAVCKENVEAIEVENKERSVPVFGSKDLIQNEMLAKASKALVSAPIVTKEDEVACSVKESISKHICGSKCNGVCMEGSDPFADPGDPSLKVSSVLSAPNSSNNKSCSVNLPEAVSSVVDSGTVSHPSHAFTDVKCESTDEQEETKATDNHNVAGGSVSHPHCQNVLKSRKPMKFQVAGVHFRPSLMLRASLWVCKKKKHKTSRKHTFKNDLRKNSLSDLEPSTSEKTRMEDLVLSCTQRQKDKSDAKNGHDRTAASELMESHCGVESKERVDQNSVLLTGTELPVKASTANSCNSKECDNRQSKSFGHGFVNLLTKGLEDTTVARWDQRETHPSKILENSPSIKIGYVPDEWDVEYDRGKRKKVKRKMDCFNGPNLFQEFAEKKSPRKKG